MRRQHEQATGGGNKRKSWVETTGEGNRRRQQEKAGVDKNKGHSINACTGSEQAVNRQ
jgi:hypothetical protein